VKLSNLALCSTLLLSPAVLAEEVTIKADGVIDIMQTDGVDLQQYAQGDVRATVWLTYETETPSTIQTLGQFRYDDAVRRVQFELYEAETGDPIQLNVVNDIPASAEMDISNFFRAEIVEGQGEYPFWSAHTFLNTQVGNDHVYLSTTIVDLIDANTEDALFTDSSHFPTFNETDHLSNLIRVYTYTNETELDLIIFNSTVGYVQAEVIIDDADGDGYADVVDSCPASILDANVTFADSAVDAGVENKLDASGCSIMDHYAACVVPEEEQPVRGIRSVRSGPSSCEKAVSYDLVADSVISYAEARLLRSALYQSYR